MAGLFLLRKTSLPIRDATGFCRHVSSYVSTIPEGLLGEGIVFSQHGDGSASVVDSTGRFARELLRVHDMPALGALVAREARQGFGCADMCIVWRSSRPSTSELARLICAPANALTADRLDRLADELDFAAPGVQELASHWFALPSLGDIARVALVWPVTANAGIDKGPEWACFIDDLACTAERLLEMDSLAHSVQRLARAERVQRALFAIATMASSDLDMPDMLHGIHEIIGELMYAENFFIALYEAERDSLRFLYFADSEDREQVNPAEEIPAASIPNSLTLATIRSGQSQMGHSRQIRERLGISLESSLGPVSMDWLGVPMIGAGLTRGAIVVQSYRPETRFSEEDRALLIYVAQHILTALERKQAQEELEHMVEKRTRELALAIGDLQLEVTERQRGEHLQRALFRIAERASMADSLDGFYASVHEIVGELLNARNFYIALLSDDGRELEFPYSVDEIDPVRPRRRLGNGMTEHVLRTGRPVLADRTAVNALRQSGQVRSFGPRSFYWLGVPLICDERTVGVLAVQSYSVETPFTVRDQELLTFVAYHIANALERKLTQESLRHAYVELEARVEERTRELAEANRDLVGQIAERERVEARLMHQTLHDTLTGLPNRAFLLERLGYALTHYSQDYSHNFAVLFLDLDRFKVINDSVGHLVGDEMLKQAAARLAAVCAPHMVARLGGDEFAVLVDDMPHPEHAVAVAERLLAALVDPMRVIGKEMFTSASIGIAYANPNYKRAEELLRDADAAMYRAKAQGRQRYEIFDERLRIEALRALELENDLRHALARSEFEPYFQSIVSLADGAVVGYEALLRWRHPKRGLLLPGDFLAAAEENGSIEQIDWQMFAMACDGARSLPEHTYISINVSARQLRTEGFDELALQAIEASGLHPGRVRLEVTEGALLDEPEQMRRTLLRLRAAGVFVKLDDFGTGYSSLSYLHRFPIHSLKIDRSFVADLAAGGSSSAVIRAIRALAESLDIEVIAEGIETVAQRDALIGLGCAIGQGFLFSRPCPLDELC
jgi:diguanylate cyclase (GGDEF)-like protein